ncbi:MAG TPA: helix-turn-helix domain-containing protein [Lachnospiraceae bacterium]|nr:helix-turn-helix domain-containing protein [Lachnospiraceae bacterium]HEX3076451.1 helix-turn-helix domain-containing protein [Lachnospiraceae bacterium]
MENEKDLFGICPYITAQKLLSGKWTLLILHHLLEGTKRFNEIQRLLPDLTQATLTKQLRYLEEHGLVIRMVYPQVPPKVEYSLSEIGMKFHSVLDELKVWGEDYIEYLKQK